MKSFSVLFFFLFVSAISACQPENSITLEVSPTKNPTLSPFPTVENAIEAEPLALTITLSNPPSTRGIVLDTGGDVDTVMVEIDGVGMHQSGNGEVLSSTDGNHDADSYLQFNVNDNEMFAGSPSTHIQIEVDYLDQGTDTFMLEYDANPTSLSKGVFTNGGAVRKTDSGEIRTATFNLCDAYFANRDNGADFRIGDNLDGAEIIREVRVTGLTVGEISSIIVDDFGANPFDDQTDSDAIQQALDSSCSGDTIVFTSGVNTDGYQGYLVDQTLFLTGFSAKHDLTFTASDPQNHALLRASKELKGYVVRLYARSRFSTNGNIYNIDYGFIDVHGGRDVRVCMGTDQIDNGIGDNWGSWLPECTQPGDPWCSPGNLAFDGGSKGINAHDFTSKQGECGTGLAFFVGDGPDNIIQNVTIDTVGDHVHVKGCKNTDDDGDYGGWSDGMTVEGRNIQIINNTIINPSDIGIVLFGGKGTIIANNIIKITEGNYGAFGAIAFHPWIDADASGIQITGNIIVNEGDNDCGGLHTGINIGPHMWGGACVNDPATGTYGNPSCSADPNPDQTGLCLDDVCQVWLMLPKGETFTLRDNTITGAHINYLIEGFIIKGQFIDENNVSLSPRQSDWEAARLGCEGLTWGPLGKVAHNPSLSGYIDLKIHCER
ncbi:hypothetical protein KKF04_04635 [Patescibacteria group bacterium]|nr:hypothetical protein [Patescibacteria group bacterium]